MGYDLAGINQVAQPSMLSKINYFSTRKSMTSPKPNFLAR